MEIKLDPILYDIFDGGDPLPKRQTKGSAAFDLVTTTEEIIQPGETALIDTGVSISIGPDLGQLNTAALVLPRSSLGIQGLMLSNTVGLIDPDYQGKIMLKVWNRTNYRVFHFTPGDRVAQLLFIPFLIPTFKVVEKFTKTTARGIGGFGSTGV